MGYYWPQNDPTPAEIAFQCSAIQATWKPSTRASREVCPPVPVSVMRVSVPGWLRDVVEADES